MANDMVKLPNGKLVSAGSIRQLARYEQQTFQAVTVGAMQQKAHLVTAATGMHTLKQIHGLAVATYEEVAACGIPEFEPFKQYVANAALMAGDAAQAAQAQAHQAIASQGQRPEFDPYSDGGY